MRNWSLEFTELAEHHAMLRHDVNSQFAITGGRLHFTSTC